MLVGLRDVSTPRDDPAHPVSAVAILAHQGGWDEILMVLGPIALMVVLLRLAKKRVQAKQALDTAPATKAAVPAASGKRSGADESAE